MVEIISTVILMSLFILGVVATSAKYEDMLGIDYTSMKVAKQECEQHLPRDKHCEIVVTVKEVE